MSASPLTDETRVENMNITQEEDQYDQIEYTLINSEAGQSYLVWVSAVNFVGEGPLTEPGMIALPSIPESKQMNEDQTTDDRTTEFCTKHKQKYTCN